MPNLALVGEGMGMGAHTSKLHLKNRIFKPFFAVFRSALPIAYTDQGEIRHLRVYNGFIV